jgi:hypothetical protein
LPPELRTAEDQEPRFELVVRGLGEKEYEVLGERAERKPTKKEREAGITGKIVDRPRLKRLMVLEATISPSWHDPGLMAKYGPMAEHVIQRWLMPGEVDQVSDVITNLSGWGEGALERVKK